MEVQFDVIGKTPYSAKKRLALSQRAIEIKQFLDKNAEKYNVISWCALDDMDLYAKGQKWEDECTAIMDGHFVKTDESKGITDKNAKQAILLLNGAALK